MLSIGWTFSVTLFTKHYPSTLSERNKASAARRLISILIACPLPHFCLKRLTSPADRLRHRRVASDELLGAPSVSRRPGNSFPSLAMNYCRRTSFPTVLRFSVGTKVI